jgi:signal transduction histidine kinase/DNA-binding response OmpR family regulator
MPDDSSDRQTYRILVVDDEPEIVSYLSELLTEQGYAVETAHTGEEALVAMRAGSSLSASEGIDLVILDVRIPEPDGYEVSRRAKADEVLRHIPIIMVTALKSKQNVMHGLEIGADDYIAKPFSPEELLARVKAMLRMRQMERNVLRHNRELTALNTIASVVNRSLNLEEILPVTLETILSLLGMRAGAVCLRSGEGGHLAVQAQQGFPEAGTGWLRRQRWSAGRGIVGQVAASGEPALLKGAAIPEPWVSATVSETDPSEEQNLSLLCVPLPAQDRVLGALVVLRADPPGFDDPDQSLLAAIGQQIGISADNARLYTELRQFAQELERSQAQLVQAEKLAAMGRLTASIAHELNNPLQAVQNCLHLTLNRQLDGGKQHRYLTMAQEEVERLIDIVLRMLDFYRPSRGQRTPTDINALIENVLALTAKKLQRGNVTVHLQLARSLPRINVVADQIKQVILNMIINAIEAMPGRGELVITSRLENGPDGTDDGWLRISFADNGVGLAPEELQHIFEPFYTTKSRGTGLGLAVSYGIVERHGGQIDVKSVPDQGTLFSVRLPLAAPGGESNDRQNPDRRRRAEHPRDAGRGVEQPGPRDSHGVQR